jgi:hypothetical protein
MVNLHLSVSETWCTPSKRLGGDDVEVRNSANCETQVVRHDFKILL